MSDLLKMGLPASVPSRDELVEAKRSLILSPAGWRKVSAKSGNEEDTDPEPSPADLVLAGLAAMTYAEFVGRKVPGESLTIAVATDTRPTGPAISGIIVRVLAESGIRVRYLGIAATPEILSYARSKDSGINAFCYVSASHNPIGHNGLKFGMSDGALLDAAASKALIDDFLLNFEKENIAQIVIEKVRACPNDLFASILGQREKFKAESLRAYSAFSNRVVFETEDGRELEAAKIELRDRVSTRGIGVVAELNGSARTLTIDADYLRGLGVKLKVVNGVPGRIAHRIVPEGRSLDQCRRELEAAHSEDPDFVFAYVPDNDGDRGNLVFMDADGTRAVVPEAQDVFALCCIVELSFLVRRGVLSYGNNGRALQKVAIAVNDPTSMRIEAIARAFDVEVFRAEVGEANVVSLAAKLRAKGYIVRILGEGSNGGNITHPSSVRDPLSTICGILKLLSLRDQANGLFSIWCARLGIACNPDFGISDVFATIPAFTTTPVYEDRAIMKIRSRNHGALKARYEALFPREWDSRRAELRKRLGIVTWEEINYEGINELRGVGKNYRSGQESGGFKILFRDEAGKETAFIWMRGSGTEPVFRILVDVRGNSPDDESMLLDWHRRMIEQADSVDQVAAT